MFWLGMRCLQSSRVSGSGSGAWRPARKGLAVQIYKRFQMLSSSTSTLKRQMWTGPRQYGNASFGPPESALECDAAPPSAI